MATHTDSDPGDKKLHMMAADPVFAQLPAPLRKDSETDTPARYETPGFGSGGSFGASVTVMFTGPSDMKQVYTLIAQSAANNGWTPKGSDSAGITNRWVKTYPDGSYATLLLSRTDPKSSTSTAYTLEGGI